MFSSITRVLSLVRGNFTKLSSNSRVLWLRTVTLRSYSMVSLPENGPNPYIERSNESITDMKSRLLYQSRKRGMSENGLILSTFAGKYLKEFNESQLHLYDKLINIPSNDWDLFYWATGVKETPKEFENEVMDLLKRHEEDSNSYDVEIDLDELLDIEGDFNRKAWLGGKVIGAKKSQENVEKFISELLQRAKTL